MVMTLMFHLHIFVQSFEDHTSMKNKDLINAVSKATRLKHLKDRRECIHINEQ